MILVSYDIFISIYYTQRSELYMCLISIIFDHVKRLLLISHVKYGITLYSMLRILFAMEEESAQTS